MYVGMCLLTASFFPQVSGQDVSVFFLDYGNTEIVSVANVKELKETFRGLPAQAVKCSLHGIVPTSGMWNNDAAKDL